jgi:hypothetical protein
VSRRCPLALPTAALAWAPDLTTFAALRIDGHWPWQRGRTAQT